MVDFTSWTEAWNRYLCTRLAAHPQLALELAKYQTILAMLFSQYPASHCLRYDRLFHQAATHDPTLHWDELKEDVYVWCFTRHASPLRPTDRRTALGQSFRDRPDINSRLGPPPPTSASSELWATTFHTRLLRASSYLHALRQRDLPQVQLWPMEQGRRMPIRPRVLDPGLPWSPPGPGLYQAAHLSSPELIHHYDTLALRGS